MRIPLVVGVLGLLCLPPSPMPAVAAPLDGSTPILCAIHSVIECGGRGDCERGDPSQEQIPAFVQINVPKKTLSSVDGARTSPITGTNRANGRLMIQGMQNERVWGAVVDEETGRMSATVSEAGGAIILTGACLAQ